MVTAKAKSKNTKPTARPKAGPAPFGISPKQLLTQIRENSFPAVLLIVGPDPIRINRLIAAVLSTAEKSIATGRPQTIRPKKFQGASLSERDVNEIHVQSATLSMFSKQQIFQIDGVDQIKAALNATLADLVETYVAPNLLILTASALPSNSVLRSRCAAKGALLGSIVDLSEFTPQELRAWTARELSNAAVVDPSNQIVEGVIVLADSKPDRIAAISSHLSLYCDGRPPTLRDLSTLFHSQSQVADFALLDAVQSGNRLRTTTTIHQLLGAGKSPFLLLAMLGRTFGQYLTISAARAQNLGATQIKSLVPMQPWLFDKYVAASSRYSLPRLRNANAAIVRADSLLKNRSLGADAILETLCCELTPDPRKHDSRN